MEKIALITDSSTGLPQEYLDKYDIHVLRLKIIYKDKEYIEGISITGDEVYANLSVEVPTTSMPSVDDAINLFEDLISKGYTHVIALPISAGLSGTINSIRLAAEQFEDKITTFIYDTKLVSMAVGLMVIETGKLIKEGKTFEHVCNKIPTIRKNTEIFFTVDTLEYLIKGGRIGKLSGHIGELLSLKPIIVMNDEGKYTSLTKTRGTKQAIKKLIQCGNEMLDKGKCNIVILSGTMPEEAQMLKEALSTHPNANVFHVGTISPVIGIHSGPRAIGFGIVLEDLQ